MFYDIVIWYYGNMIYNKLRKAGYTFIITHHDRNNMLADLNKINGTNRFKVEEDVNKEQ